jgi:hypothetical protein
MANYATSVELLGGWPVKGAQKVYFEPFSVGVGAVAGDEFDHLALMMVKGFSDGLEARGRFTLVSGDDADTADIVIKGRIDGFKRRGFFRKTVSMKVRGDVCLASNDEVLAIIYVQRWFKNKGKNSDKAAYDVGYVVAHKLSE